LVREPSTPLRWAAVRAPTAALSSRGTN
jgi:hypothetical protein